MHPILWTLAQAEGAPQQPGWGSMIFPFVLVIGIWYFLVIRPQNKHQEEKKKLLAALQKGDRVVLKGGIHGRIHEVQQDTFLVEIADKVRIKVNKDAVQGLPTPVGDAVKTAESAS